MKQYKILKLKRLGNGTYQPIKIIGVFKTKEYAQAFIKAWANQCELFGLEFCANINCCSFSLYDTRTTIWIK